MDLSTWTWAIGVMLGVLADVFGKGLSLLGSSLPTITTLILIAAVVRLIFRPLVGMYIGDVVGGLHKRGLNETKKDTRREVKK